MLDIKTRERVYCSTNHETVAKEQLLRQFRAGQQGRGIVVKTNKACEESRRCCPTHRHGTVSRVLHRL